MAVLTIQPAAHTGLNPSYAAASAGGDQFPPGEDVMLHVKNADATSKTVTVLSPTPCSQGATHNLAVAVPAGTERMIGPLPAGRFAQPSTGLVHVTYSAVTAVTVAAIVA